MERNLGFVLIAVGVAVVVLGLLVWSGGLSWFGRLPGDIRIEGERTRLYVPIISMLLVSIVATVAVNLVTRWWR